VVQRRQRRERLERAEHGVVDRDRARVARPAVHDAVADGDRRRAAQVVVQPARHDAERASVTRGRRGWLRCGIVHHEAWVAPDTVDDPMPDEAWGIGCSGVEE
jgi:hypothetical protein